MLTPGVPYQPPMNRGPMKPSFPAGPRYRSPIARIPENRPAQPNMLGGGTAPMQRPPMRPVDPRQRLAQLLVERNRQRQQISNRPRY